MALKRRNQRRVEFNSSSMSDLVFLLLIFFMLTSTLVAPNAIKLLLPQSSSRTMAKQTVTVYINDKMDYFVDDILYRHGLVGTYHHGAVDGAAKGKQNLSL